MIPDGQINPPMYYEDGLEEERYFLAIEQIKYVDTFDLFGAQEETLPIEILFEISKMVNDTLINVEDEYKKLRELRGER